MDLSDMQAWSLPLGTATQESTEPIEYHEPDVESLAERCASMTGDWDDGVKLAGTLEPALLYKDPDAHPFVLMLLTLDRYGSEVLGWSPEVLRVTLARDNLQVSGTSFAKLMAAETLLMTPSPWRQWHIFHVVSRALAGLPPSFVYLEQPELGHLFVAADLMKICDPKRLTTGEVDKFIAAAFRHEGQVFAPEPLAFAQRELEQRRLSCGKCGAEFEDNNDQKCVTCGATGLVPLPYVFQELRDQGSALWSQIKNLPLEQALERCTDTPIGNMIYQLFPHWDYARRIRRQLVMQLRGLAK